MVYLRTSGPDGRSVKRSLVLAKTRVAPLRQVSLPRLELCAASMLTRLVSHVRGTLELSAAAVHLWSDSSVVLGWILGHPARWTTFVANRVSEIQRMLPEGRWHHVKGEVNPADCASRGISPGELRGHALWWGGPDFLANWSAPFPDRAASIGEEDLPEQRRSTHVVEMQPAENELLARFSTLHRLIRITAWMLRWRGGLAALSGGPLTVEELDAARTRWIKLEQKAAYSKEMAAIGAGRQISGRSSLLALSPFLDSGGLLRVGGRLRHSDLAEDLHHLIILPSKSRVTALLIVAMHSRVLHGGAQMTLAVIRQLYWIPRGRQLVREAIHRCPSCVRWRAAVPQPRMGELPRSRVTPSRPFSCAGVDYAGPFYVRTAKGRGQGRIRHSYASLSACPPAPCILKRPRIILRMHSWRRSGDLYLGEAYVKSCAPNAGQTSLERTRSFGPFSELRDENPGK